MTGGSTDAIAGLTAAVRAFVGLPCPDGLRRSIATGLEEWRRIGANVAWADPGRIHVTLRFLGDADPAALARLDAELRAVAGGAPPVEARAASVGVFPGWNRPRVLWLGLESGGAVERLATAVESAARSVGFEAEERRFTAHLTLGRVRSPRGVRRAVAALREWEVDDRPCRIESMVLYRSRLDPGGARHEPLSVHPLGVPHG